MENMERLHEEIDDDKGGVYKRMAENLRRRRGSRFDDKTVNFPLNKFRSWPTTFAVPTNSESLVQRKGKL